MAICQSTRGNEWLSSLFLLVCVAVGSNFLGNQLQGQEFTKEQLSDIGVASRSSVRVIRYASTLRTEGGEGAVSLDGVISELSCRILLDIVGGRFRYSKQESRGSSVLTYNGSIECGLIEDEQNPSGVVARETRSNLNIYAESKLLIAAMMCPATPSGVGADDGSFESFMKCASVREVRQDIEGHSCFVLDGNIPSEKPNEPRKIFMTVWIDPQIGGMPRQLHLFGRDGEIATEQVNTDFSKFEAIKGEVSIWLPLKSRITTKVRGLAYRQSLEFSDIEINPPIDEEDFTISFPPGTHVFDSDSGERFDIPGELGLNTTGVPDSSSRTWPVLANLVVILGVAGWFIWSRQRRNRASNE